MDKSKLTVIIASRNESDLSKTVDSLFKSIGPDTDVIVVNDNSDEFKLKSRDKLTILENEIPEYGLYDAIHKAVEVASDKIFWCNARCRFTEGWDSLLIAALDEHKQTIFTPVVVDGKKRYYGAEVTERPENQHTHYQVKGITNKKQHPVVHLGGMGINKGWFLELEGFYPLQVRGAANQFIGLKSWKAGGDVQLIDFEIENKFRKETSYPVTPATQIYNYVVMAFILFGPGYAVRVLDSYKDDRAYSLAKLSFVYDLGMITEYRDKLIKLKKRELSTLLT